MGLPSTKVPQALTYKFDGIANQILTPVEVFAGFDPAASPVPAPTGVKVNALWDTGASKSVISPAVAKSLSLTPVGATQVNHAGGSGRSPTYLVNFVLPNRFMVAGVIVTEFASIANGFQAIIGMDILSLGDFALTHVSGKTWMSFRIPSTTAVDFVVESNRRIFAGVQRNDPCPCGKLDATGKPEKFKKCHGSQI